MLTVVFNSQLPRFSIAAGEPQPKTPLAMTARILPLRRVDWRVAIGGAVLAAAAAAVYARTFSVPLLLDDAASIVENPTIRHWSRASPVMLAGTR